MDAPSEDPRVCVAPPAMLPLLVRTPAVRALRLPAAALGAARAPLEKEVLGLGALLLLLALLPPRLQEQV